MDLDLALKLVWRLLVSWLRLCKYVFNDVDDGLNTQVSLFCILVPRQKITPYGTSGWGSV